jgi:hypothetical protein
MKRKNEEIEKKNKKIKKVNLLTEIYMEIFEYLNGKDLNNIKITCKLFYQIQNNENFQYNQCKLLNFYHEKIKTITKESALVSISNSAMEIKYYYFLGILF